MLTLKVFIEQHWAAHRQMSKYCVQARGRKNVSDALVERMANRSARSCYTTNLRSRIEFARAASMAFEALHMELRDRQFAFVTLTPKTFATTLSDAPDFDHQKLKAWAYRELRGSTFVAVVEGAYFTNLNVVPGIHEPMVSWHVHALVWGRTFTAVDHMIARINAMHESVLPGHDAAHRIPRLSLDSAVARLIYMLKAPLGDYRVFPMKAEVADRDGAVEIRNTGEFKIKKGRLKPGALAKMFAVMGDRTIPMLTFASMDLKRFWPSVERRAKTNVRRDDDQRSARLARQLGSRFASTSA